MNQDVKAKWVAALRSEEYIQTKGYLHQGDGYCCLGVLCDIAVKEGVIEERITANVGNFGHLDSDQEYASSETGLPYPVREWAGLSDASPDVPFDKYGEWDEESNVPFPQKDLATLNDDENLTFEQIADLIEVHL